MPGRRVSRHREQWRATGARVRQARTTAGLSQCALAEALGMNRTSYVQLEQGNRSIKALELAAIAERLGVPYADLFVSSGQPLVADPPRRRRGQKAKPMKKIRCKFQVQSITKVAYDPNTEVVKLGAVGDGTEENESFSKWTPSGSLEITVNNPNVVGNITLGAYYYLDLTLCEPA